MEAKKLNNLSVPEYLSVEKETSTRHEYHDGEIFAMAGGTLEHGLISGNVFGEIKFALRTKKSNCTVLNSDVKLHIKHSNKFVYPDAMVVWGTLEKADSEADAIINPVAIIEVLSRSTEAYDRGDKFFIYRSLACLQEYILIDQYKAQVEIYSRKGDLWNIGRVSGLDQIVEIASLGISIELGRIYESVTFL